MHFSTRTKLCGFHNKYSSLPYFQVLPRRPSWLLGFQETPYWQLVPGSTSSVSGVDKVNGTTLITRYYSLLIFILAYPSIYRYIFTIVNKIRRMIKSSFFVGKHKIQKLNSMGFAFPLIQEFGFRHTVQLDGCGGCGLPVHVVSLAVLPQTESRVQSSEWHTAAVSVCHVCNATHALRNLYMLLKHSVSLYL